MTTFRLSSEDYKYSSLKEGLLATGARISSLNYFLQEFEHQVRLIATSVRILSLIYF